MKNSTRRITTSKQVPSTPSRTDQLKPIPSAETPSLQSPSTEERCDDGKKPVVVGIRRKLNSCKASKRLNFGQLSDIEVLEKTRRVYSIVSKMTGSIGGNGHGGAIYGELTAVSMQKMVDLMKVHTNFGPDSRFIDVGSGLGKPNLHVTQDPGVEFSYGIEMEHVRWVLGMSNLNMVLQYAAKNPCKDIRHRCCFQHGDITQAKYFDPFTHVYMFDIGFPPKLFNQLAEMFNRSESPYLICYHGPKLIIERYGFNVELLVQSPTSMHGSSEVHSGYIYRRVESLQNNKGTTKPKKCTKRRTKKEKDDRVLLDGEILSDPLFANAWKSTRRDLVPVLEDVRNQVLNNLSSQRPRRKRKAVCLI